MPEDMGCCSCREDGELLTAAWRDSVEKEHSRADSIGTGELPEMFPAGSRQAEGSATATRGVPPTLQVPPEFDSVRLDKPLEMPTGKPDERTRLLQSCLRSFTRALLRGIRMSVLLDDGRTLLTEASLDSELTHLVLHMPNVQCPVALGCIESICSPDEVSAGAVLIANQAHLDDRCTTLVLRGGQFLTFVFEAPRPREYFEMCLKVVILAKGGSDMPGGGASQTEASRPPALAAKINAVSPDAGHMAPLAPRREKPGGVARTNVVPNGIDGNAPIPDEPHPSTGEQGSEAGSETTLRSKNSKGSSKSKLSFLSKGRDGTSKNTVLE